MIRFTKPDAAAALLLLASACVLTLGLAMTWDQPSDAQDQRRLYCDMVTMWRSDHRLGWPDYRHTYDLECIDTTKEGSTHEKR